MSGYFTYHHECAARRSTVADQREAAAVINSDPTRLIDAIEHLTGGNYGALALDAWRGLAERPRMNRRAWLTIHAASAEWSLSIRHAQTLWHLLTPETQRVVTTACDAAVHELDASVVKPKRGIKHQHPIVNGPASNAAWSHVHRKHHGRTGPVIQKRKS